MIGGKISSQLTHLLEQAASQHQLQCIKISTEIYTDIEATLQRISSDDLRVESIRSLSTYKYKMVERLIQAVCFTLDRER